ncbi:MAG: NYN domain-containing protein [Chloroflexi bacterium]|nr:NYN domain-containing protein [Chloroflexota bacterium]
MSLIIDGHNLIPKIPGLTLDKIDDEERLIDLLQLYAGLRGKEIDVFFDGAPPGQSGVRAYGRIRAHFVAAGLTADEAIRRYLVSLGRRARNMTVVTSDRMVQANARRLQAGVMPAEDFARELSAARAEESRRSELAKTQRAPGRQPAGERSRPPAMSPKELQGWLDLFGIDPAQANEPIEPESRPRRKKKRK